MHARVADHYGKPPQPICAKVKGMPFWDQTKSFGDSLGSQPIDCRLLMSPATDKKLLDETFLIVVRGRRRIPIARVVSFDSED